MLTARLQRLIADPNPVRFLARKALQEFRIGSYERRMKLGAVDRPHYAYCVYNAALLAQRLGIQRISVIEFGVAGGNGLVNLEYHAQNISSLCSVSINIYGFDRAKGLPEPVDYRDLPYQWKEGFFKMDVPRLKARLKKAKLVLGDVEDTSKDFFEKYNPAPIGAIAYDLDYYSSTVAALNMLGAGERYYLPRVFCYFDNTLSLSNDAVSANLGLHNDYTGERLAINEFNQAHHDMKFGLPYHLLAMKIVEPWYHQIWICHFFNHARYNDFVGDSVQQLPCK